MSAKNSATGRREGIGEVHDSRHRHVDPAALDVGDVLAADIKNASQGLLRHPQAQSLALHVLAENGGRLHSWRCSVELYDDVTLNEVGLIDSREHAGGICEKLNQGTGNRLTFRGSLFTTACT